MRKLSGFSVLALFLALLAQTASADPFIPNQSPPPNPEPVIVIIISDALAGGCTCEIFWRVSIGYCGGDPVNATDPMGLYITFNGGQPIRSIEQLPLIVQDYIKNNYNTNERDELIKWLYDSVNHPFTSFAGLHRRFTKNTDVFISGMDWGQVGKSAAEQASETVEGAGVILNGDAGTAYNQIIDQQAAAASMIYLDEGDDSWAAASYVAGNFTGATPLLEGTYGNDLATKRRLNNIERWSRGLQGGGSLLLNFTGAASAATSTTRLANRLGRLGVSGELRLSARFAAQQARSTLRWASSLRIGKYDIGFEKVPESFMDKNVVYMNSGGGGRLGIRFRIKNLATSSQVPESYMNKALSIDTRNAPSNMIDSLNAAGYPRAKQWFWEQMLENYPTLFSPRNVHRINSLGLAPEVDAQWVKYYPEHGGFMYDVLEHHHINQGWMATPLPQTVHQKWTGLLH